MFALMFVLMVGCPAGGKDLISLDDPTVWTDEGAAYRAFGDTNPIDFGRTATAGKFRRIAQAVTITRPCALVLTPFVDGNEVTEQAVSTDLDPAVAATQVVVAEPALDGRRFQYRMEPTGFTGPIEFGEADLAMIPKSTA